MNHHRGMEMKDVVGKIFFREITFHFVHLLLSVDSDKLICAGGAKGQDIFEVH